MKTKIVLWGANEADEKLLLGVELVDKENKVLIHKIPEATATEEVYKLMMDEWRDGKDIVWPAGHEEIVRPLTVADSLLPDDIKVERTDIIARAKAEWHFVVLSSKLYEMYHNEVDDFKDKVETLNDFDNNLWEDLKNFWTKVQNQVQDNNLFREHANKLRSRTNELFDTMKALKKTADSEFKSKSKAVTQEFKNQLNDINEKVEKGLGLKPIFEELKKMQEMVKNATVTRDDRNDLWKKIDEVFKVVKDKRFGDKQGNTNSSSRNESRYNGLISAINRMQGSIKKDVQEKDFQNKRIDNADGQLEAQIRQAKLAMIDERINSKQVKLDDMLKTKIELEGKLAKEKARDQALLEKQKADEIAKQLKAKMKEEIEAKRNDRSPEEEEELRKAAEAIAETKRKRAAKQSTESEVGSKGTQERVADLLSNKAPETVEKESLIDAITSTLGDSVNDMLDTVKAISSVVADQVEDSFDSAKSSINEVLNEETKEGSTLSNLSKKVKEAFDDVADKAEEVTESIKSSVKEAMTDAKKSAEDLSEKVNDKFDDDESDSALGGFINKIKHAVEDVVDKASEVKDAVTDALEDTMDDVKEKVSEFENDPKVKKAEDKAKSIFGAITGALSEAMDDVVETAKEFKESINDKMDEMRDEEE